MDKLLNYDIEAEAHFGYQGRVYRSLSSMQKNDLFRKTKTLYKIFKRNPETSANALAMANNMDKIITVLNNKYGNNWDFMFKPIFENTASHYMEISIIILFPEITITNANRNSHLIKDLIICLDLKFEENYPYVSEIRGNRLTLSEDELAIGYLHSHLNTMSNPSFNRISSLKPFCLGNGGELNNSIENTYAAAVSPQDLDPVIIFEALLYAIDSLVEWESLDGVPYAYINNIVRQGEVVYDISYCYNIGTVLGELTEVIRPDNTYSIIREELPNLTFNTDGIKYLIRINTEFINLAKKLIINRGTTRRLMYSESIINGSKTLKAITDSTDNTARYEMSIAEDEEGRLPYAIIQGRKIEFSIIRELTEEVEEDDGLGLLSPTFKVHPNFLTQLKIHLENLIYYEKINQQSM